jgi:hypothetical protein
LAQKPGEMDDDALQAAPAEPEDYGEPEIGARIPFVWAILAAAAIWVLVGAAAYGISLLVE